MVNPEELYREAAEAMASSDLFDGAYFQRLEQAEREIRINPVIAPRWFDKRLIERADLLAVNSDKYKGNYYKRAATALLDLCKNPAL